MSDPLPRHLLIGSHHWSLSTEKIPQIGLHSRISIAYEYSHTVFSFPSRHSFLRGGLQKYSFQAVSFRKRTYANSCEVSRQRPNYSSNNNAILSLGNYHCNVALMFGIEVAQNTIALKLAARNFLPRCIALFPRFPIYSLKIPYSSTMHHGKSSVPPSLA